MVAFTLSFSQDVSIDTLLQDIEKKTDLSSKTKLENGGVSIIYTRDEITRMQARNLKDILKSTYPLGYNENRYGLSDPYTLGTVHPYVSSSIRVFIDNQEMLSGLYGSGMVLYGDLDISFVDHIEVYIGNPTYEYSTEPTFILIKLYSKKASKDAGSKLTLGLGNYGDSYFNAYNSADLENDWSYFASASFEDDKRKKYTSHETELSRDKQTSFLFGSFSNKNNHFIVNAGMQPRDTFIDQSLDATPTKATMKNKFIYLGYDGEYKNFSYLLSYNYLETTNDFKDEVTPLPSFGYLFPVASVDLKSISNVISSELKYKYEVDWNKLVVGVKYRYKGYKYRTLARNNFVVDPRLREQNVATVFLENQYSLYENSIITTGVSASMVENSDSDQDDNLLMYRAGYTYTNSEWISKTIYSHMELSLDPYLVNSDGVYITPGKKDITKQDVFMQNIVYEHENNKYELILSAIKTKNQLMPNLQSGLLENYAKTIDLASGVFMWTHGYNRFDSLYLTVAYNKITNIPAIGKFTQYISTLRNLNSYKKFDIFNELLFYRDNSHKVNYYDYSAGVIYHHTQDLSLSIKGTNILNRAKPTIYTRVSPVTFTREEPLSISPIDPQVMIMMEYLF